MTTERPTQQSSPGPLRRILSSAFAIFETRLELIGIELQEEQERLIGVLLKQYPIVGSLASLILTKPVRTKLLRSAKPVLKWGGLALAGWEGWRIYQQMKTAAPETSTNAVDPTVF